MSYNHPTLISLGINSIEDLDKYKKITPGTEFSDNKQEKHLVKAKTDWAAGISDLFCFDVERGELRHISYYL